MLRRGAATIKGTVNRPELAYSVRDRDQLCGGPGFVAPAVATAAAACCCCVLLLLGSPPCFDWATPDNAGRRQLPHTRSELPATFRSEFLDEEALDEVVADDLAAFISAQAGPGIVYARSRKACELVAELLGESPAISHESSAVSGLVVRLFENSLEIVGLFVGDRGADATPYHAGLKDRSKTQVRVFKCVYGSVKWDMQEHGE